MNDAGERAREIRQMAVAAVDRWVTVHCRPDRIALTHGAMLNLANVIAETIAAALTDLETANAELRHAIKDAEPMIHWAQSVLTALVAAYGRAQAQKANNETR